MSFLDKLKVKVEEKIDTEEIKDGVIDKNSGFMQLEVDIFQTAEDIIIVATIPSVEVSDIDISIENENDVVTIQGKIEQPDLSEYTDEADADVKYLRQECQWGRFYRQIILPQEINVSDVEAKFKRGLLILRLPLLLLQSAGKKKIAVNVG
ncbi:Hsp20/alpha crystallin family protein [Candidatus Parcubacteria bacterium]|nr:Hsp20/alpha crystallin family protein [Candidatus Parcubacteria bacterium]